MNKFSKISVLGFFLLFGCDNSGNRSSSAIVDQIIAFTIQTCRFVPTIDTVTGILGRASPELSTALTISKAICSSIQPQTTAGGATVFPRSPAVSGVPIKGRFIR